MEAAWLAGKGAGVLVGVADTGCDFACPALRGRIAFRRAFGKESLRHGTHICSAIALAAPECRLAVATGAMETPGALAAAHAEAKAQESSQEIANAYAHVVSPAMERLRAAVDAMEPIVASDYWPVPTYNDILFYA